MRRPERKAPWRTAAVACALAVVAAGLAAQTVPAKDAGSRLLPEAKTANAGGGEPPGTSSFYVFGSYVDVCGLSATSECPLYNYGAAERIPPSGGMTILDFGAPCFEPATLAWGSQLFNSQSCTADAVITVLAQAWLRGFQTNAGRSASPGHVLVAGTSNSLTAAIPGNALTPAEMSSHGQAWFKSVIAPIAAVARSLPTPVTTWAGNDIEESGGGDWYDAASTGAWVDAYAAASGASKPCVAGKDGLMADYGDYVPNQPGWSAGAVYHVAWQSAPACPVPEIYYTVNAGEWQSLNRFAQSAGLPPMQFTGVLSEDGAGGTLSVSGSWNALKAATGQSAPYLSVVPLTRAASPEVPDPPAAVTALPGPGLVTVSWSAPAWDGGAWVTAYTVTVYAGSILVGTVTVSGSPVPEKAIVTGLSRGASYRFYVRASNRVGTGPPSWPSGYAVPSAPFTVE